MYFSHILVTHCCGYYTCHGCVELFQKAEKELAGSIRRGCQFYCDDPDKPVYYSDVVQDERIQKYNDMDVSRFSIRRKSSKKPNFELDQAIPLSDLDRILS